MRVTFGGMLVVAGLAFLLVLAILGSLFYTLPRVRHYQEILGQNSRLTDYRDRVRQTVLNAGDYGLIGAEFLRQLELAVNLTDGQGQATSSLVSRSGGMYMEDVYINFLENVPTLAPVDGYVTRGLRLHELDLEANHAGVDIAAPVGAVVRAAASGLVVLSHWTEDLGNMVILAHGDHYISVYAHNQTNLVRPRERVKRGQPIALVGETGVSGGPHLHFEIWNDARALDPRKFIQIYRDQDVSLEPHG